MKLGATACCALFVLAGSAAGAAHGQTAIQQAIEARNRGAIFESIEILEREGAGAPAEVRVEQAINAYYLGRYQQARGILAGVLADPAANQALRNRAVAWVLRINRRQLIRLQRKPFSLSAAFGAGSDSNANNALDVRIVDDFEPLPGGAAAERQSDSYAFYRLAAGYAAQPADAGNLDGHPFVYRWTSSVSHYGRQFSEVDAWDAQYTRLAGALAFRKHRKWAGSVNLSVLDYRLDSERLLAFGSAGLSYRRLMRPVNLGVQTTFQRLDYKRAAWSARTGNRVRVQLFVEGPLAPGHTFRAGIEPQRFRAGDESRSYRGFRAQLLHAWQGRDWRLHSRLIYEKNKYEAEETGFGGIAGPDFGVGVEPGFIGIDLGAADERRDKRLRLSVNLVRPLTRRLDLSLAVQYMNWDSTLNQRALSKRQADVSVRYRF